MELIIIHCASIAREQIIRFLAENVIENHMIIIKEEDEVIKIPELRKLDIPICLPSNYKEDKNPLPFYWKFVK